jgi:hypothetical protein
MNRQISNYLSILYLIKFNIILSMFKLTTLLFVFLIFSIGNGLLHDQKFAPSQPGGTFYGTNGTQSTTNNTSVNPTVYPTTILINGRPYTYTGPFTLVCYVQNSLTVFRYDSCYNLNDCASLLQQYSQCLGTVKKFPV